MILGSAGIPLNHIREPKIIEGIFINQAVCFCNLGCSVPPGKKYILVGLNGMAIGAQTPKQY